MTPRAHKYFRRKKLPTYRLQVFGGTSYGKSLYAKLMSFPRRCAYYAIDKDGCIYTINAQQAQDTIDHWNKR